MSIKEEMKNSRTGKERIRKKRGRRKEDSK